MFPIEPHRARPHGRAKAIFPVSNEPNPTNPLREGLQSRPMPQPCNVVIFGASGDLTFRKLIPALYNLAADGDLPASTNIVGFARREKTDESWRTELRDSTEKCSRSGLKDDVWGGFSKRIYYQTSDFTNAEGYRALREKLDSIDAAGGAMGNRLFYLSVSPTEYDLILRMLAESGLNKPRAGAWTRVIVEKPFGTDFATAESLNESIARAFAERDTFRIDHYLGKETAQNIMVLRFANQIFENQWNNRYIDHVQITSAETLGVEARGPYYEKAGALRDMVQSHLLQLVCLTAMEPPTSLTADAVRDEKAKVVRSLRRLSPEDVARDIVRGQYGAGAINGKPVPTYRAEERVSPTSMTETYVALKLHIDNWRWHGVPFYMRVGKRLAKGGAEIAVQFKEAPRVLFNTDADAPLGPNQLVIRIQPDEGISLRLQCKVPGSVLRIEPVKMDFHYGASFGKQSPEAYERLILDAMSGDATLFARRDEVQEAWKFVDAIENAWHGETRSTELGARKDGTPGLFEYAAGSWGPKEADELLARDGHAWRRM
jgi:glucose-6-phosphate 1-dehydrogenase